MSNTFKQFTVVSSGDSLWSKQGSKKFAVTDFEFNDSCVSEDKPYELQLFGPETKRCQYTDTGIEKSINTQLLKWVQSRYPKYNITKITWSEYGMQPKNGWSFDIICSK